MRFREALKKLLRCFVGDTRQAIISYIVVALIVAGGGFLALSKTALNFSIQIITTPTPLWVIILLFLLIYLYIRITLRKQHSSANTSSQVSDCIVLDETKINILKLLYSKNMTSEQISSSLKLKLQTAAYHLEELANLEMVICRRYSESISGDVLPGYSPSLKYLYSWTLKQSGRKYLIDNKLES